MKHGAAVASLLLHWDPLDPGLDPGLDLVVADQVSAKITHPDWSQASLLNMDHSQSESRTSPERGHQGHNQRSRTKQMALSQILPELFLSGSDGARSCLLSQKGITLIVNATLTHSCPAAPGVDVLRVPVCDLPSARLDRHFDSVAERIHGNHGGTLVHCAAGMSRSPALVMAYLMRFRGASLRRAHAIVRDKRPNIRVNRGFWEQLLTYERKLYGHNTVRLAEEEGPRGAELGSNRKCLGHVTQSPLLRRRGAAVHCGNLLNRK